LDAPFYIREGPLLLNAPLKSGILSEVSDYEQVTGCRFFVTNATLRGFLQALLTTYYKELAVDLQRIIAELKQEREKLDRAIAALDGAGPGVRARRGAYAGDGRPRRRRHLSAEARKRLSDMMKKRWAEHRRKRAA
jgi:hypothetical protein